MTSATGSSGPPPAASISPAASRPSVICDIPSPIS